MCGIVGFYQKEVDNSDSKFIRDTVNYLLQRTEARGKDTAGLFVKNGYLNTNFLYKRNVRSKKMIKTLEYKNFLNEAFSFNKKSFISLSGHCRMQTDGRSDIDYNNQPVLKDGTCCSHNGIITNIEEIWKNSNFIRRYEVDSEIICDYFGNVSIDKTFSSILNDFFGTILGEANICVHPQKISKTIYATNTGSIYYIYDKDKSRLIVASEKPILQDYVNKYGNQLDNKMIFQLLPNNAIIIDEPSGDIQFGEFSNFNYNIDFNEEVFETRIDSQILNVNDKLKCDGDIGSQESMLVYDVDKIKNLKRCTKCLLPHTFPNIDFDEKGICNYCHNHVPFEVLGEEELSEKLQKYKSEDILLSFSGGRDSSYALDYLKKKDINFLTYTYDWGMVTDLARRNQSRMCAKCEKEHIIVSADIDKKRKNVRRNVKAWLKRPSLGTIPLFMAGDKQYFYYANKTAKDYNIKAPIIQCDNPFEVTYFKFGFAGAKPNFIKKGQGFSLPLVDNMRMLLFYFKEAMLNPSYINMSIFDTLFGYASYYLQNHEYINLFRYLEFDEEKVNNTLINDYDWEVSNDTKSTWRIGDGTAPFYNYIYLSVAGFTENDTFRSNQIREGKITREQGMAYILEENKPRFESLKWYLDVLDLDFEDTIRKINNIEKLF